MIVRTDWSNTYFLVLDRVCTEQQWLKASGVRPKSPAAEIAARVYGCLFHAVKDVVIEYEKYYKPEYRGLWDFLYWHYMIDVDTIKELEHIYRPSLKLFYGDVRAGGDYGVGDYAMSEEGFPIVKSILANVVKERGV